MCLCKIIKKIYHIIQFNRYNHGITGRGLKEPISYSHSDNLLHHWGTILYLVRDYRLGGITIIPYTVNPYPLLCKVPYFTP